MAKKLTPAKAREILHDKSVHGHPLTDKQRKFFGAISGGAPVQANDGWLDKFDDGGPIQENYNDASVSLPDGFVGMGYDTKGRNYSPAWGGQFAMGGSLPGAVGFTYARTAGSAPSEGPYAKKTLPSAQNGQEMRYYQEGLDWNPKMISENGGWLSKFADGGEEKPLPKIGSKEAYELEKAKQNRSESTKVVSKTAPLTEKEKAKNKEINKGTHENSKEYWKKQLEERAAKRKDPGTFSKGNYTIEEPLRLFPNSEGGIGQAFDEYMNPAYMIGRMASGLGNAGSKAYNTGDYSDLPGAIVEPLVAGALGLDPLGSAMKVPGRVAQSMESGVLSDVGNYLTTQTPLRNTSNINLELFGFGRKKPIVSEVAPLSQLEKQVLITQEDLARANRDAITFSQSPANKAKLQEFRPGQDFSVTNQQARFIDDPEALRLYESYRLENDPSLSIEQYLGGSRGQYGARDYGDLNDVVLIDKNQPFTSNIPSRSAYTDAMHETTHSRSIRLGATDAEKKIASDAWSPMIKKNNFGMPEEEAFAVQNELRADKLKDIKGDRVYTEKDIPEIKKGLQDMIDEGHEYLRGISIEDFNIPALIKSLNKIGLGAAFIGIGGKTALEQKKKGGVIKDDMGYWNPENWGKTVEISSPDITMEGVDQPLLGISDTGDTKLMQPGKNYKFKGKKVTEYPIAKNGVNQQDQKTLEQLDQLTNFTNYNKPSNWLNKYN